ncbi:MAG: glycosyltransferase family 39 protein [Chloroflexaceae bacterium]|nr:glycosyltransferase family 39 protein [Chloroflexaceae bacterium]
MKTSRVHTNRITSQKAGRRLIRWWWLIAVVSITAIALLLRVWGRAWSLPYVDHPDEPAVMNVVVRIVQGQLNPKHFFYPSLILYAQALVLHGHLWWGHLTGLYPDGFVLPRSNHFYTTIPQAFIWARVVTALLSSATVLALAVWGGRLAGRRAGVVAALLLALSPWAIIHAHYMTVDAPSGLFALLALLATWQILDHGRWRDYVLAGVLIGLAIGSKYQSGLTLVPLLLAHGLHWRKDMLRSGRRLLLAGMLAVTVFLLTSPYTLLDFADFRKTMQTLLESYDGSHGDVRRSWPFDAYLWFHWHEGLGAVPFVLAILGVGVLIRRWPAAAVVWLSFPLLLIVSLLRLPSHFYRNLLPAQPPLFLLAGIGAVALADVIWKLVQPHIRLRLRGVPSRKLLTSVILLLFLGMVSLGPATSSSARLAQPDSRVVAQEWARQHWPGVLIASEQSHPMQWQGVQQSDYVHYLPLRSVDWYRQQGYGLLLANEGRRKHEYWTADYEPLLAQTTHRATFGGNESGFLGPRIDLFSTGLTTTSVQTDRNDQDAVISLGAVQLLGSRFGRLTLDTTGPEVHFNESLWPGDVLAVLLFWQANAAVPPGNQTLFVHVRNTAGVNVTQFDAPPWQGLFPLSSWKRGQLVSERVHIPLPADLEPGEYQLVMGLYDGVSLQRFPVVVDGHVVDTGELFIGKVYIKE